MKAYTRWIVEEDHHNDIWTPWHDRQSLMAYKFKSIESAIEQYDIYKKDFFYTPPREYRFVELIIQPEYIIDRKVILTITPEENT